MAVNWRLALPVIISVFFATRILTILLAVFVETIQPAGPALSWDTRPVLTSLTGFDAIYYLGIAAEGYHLQPVVDDFPDWVFFPGYPAVTRLVSVVTLGDIAVAGVLVANVALLGALIVLFALTRRYLDHESASRTVTYITVAPGAVAFGMAYSDSLFLLVSAGAFLAAEHRRWRWMAFLLGAATLTRLPGALLVIPLAVLLWKRDVKAWMPWCGLLVAPIALAGLGLYQNAVLGDPTAFLTGQEHWNFAPRSGGDGGPMGTAPMSPVAPLLTFVLAVYLFLFVYARVDRIPLPYLVVGALAVLLSLGSLRLLSVARYLAVAWPFSWLAAGRDPPWLRAVWPIASTGLFMLFAVLHFTEAMAP